MAREIEFVKMHGAGNDYIYVNAIENEIAEPQELAIQLSQRHTGIGADGLVLIEKSSVAHFAMRIFNADGSEALTCGNALRCVGRYVYDFGLFDSSEVEIETKSGVKNLHLNIRNNRVESVTVDMGKASTQSETLLCEGKGSLINEAIEVDGVEFYATFVNMGNPHVVIFVDDVETIDLARMGRVIEHHHYFPHRTNVEFASVINEKSIAMRVWERGSGETMACGSGACATFVAAHLNGLVEREAIVRMPGGDLIISVDESSRHIMMTGDAVKVFRGVVEV